MTISFEIVPIVILVLLMAVGLIGNLHVVIVYACRLKLTNHGIYMTFLSIQDISTCIVLIPLTMDVYISLNPWAFSSEFMCRFYSFMAYLIHGGSGFTLLLVAVDRYRKICRPHGWQIKRHIAKKLCFIPVLSSCFCSWPALALRGVKTDSMQNTTITVCGVLDEYMNQQLYYNVLLAVITFGSLFILVFLYACVLRAVSNYQSIENVECDTGQLKSISYQVLKSSKEVLELTPRAAVIDCLGCEDMHNTVEGKTQSKEESSVGCSSDQIKSETSLANQQRRKRARKITLAFILITVFFCLSYIPYILLEIFKAHKTLNSGRKISIASGFLYPCIYINSVANCFIYSCFDKKFRNEIGNVYKRLYCRR